MAVKKKSTKKARSSTAKKPKFTYEVAFKHDGKDVKQAEKAYSEKQALLVVLLKSGLAKDYKKIFKKAKFRKL